MDVLTVQIPTNVFNASLVNNAALQHAKPVSIKFNASSVSPLILSIKHREYVCSQYVRLAVVSVIIKYVRAVMEVAGSNP